MVPNTLRDEAREARQYAQQIGGRILGQAEAEHRPLTTSERTTIQTAIDRARQLENRAGASASEASFLTALDAKTGGAAMLDDTRGSAGRGTGIGASIVRSELGAWLQHTKRGPHWTSPAVVVDDPRDARNSVITTTLGGSGGVLITPEYVPGIVPVPLPPPVVADLLTSAPTPSNSINYQIETLYTIGAAAVAEGAAKPESTLQYDQISEPVIKIGHWLPVTDELLDDFGGFQAYLELRLMQGVQVVESDQLLNGNGVAPNLHGLLNRSGLLADAVRGTDESNADAILRQITQIQSVTYMAPTGLVMNPANWLTIRLAKSTTNEYIGASPFSPVLGPTLWGLPVALTPAIAAGVALVVTRTAAMIFRRSGIMVMASNSHQDYFVKNLTAVRAEERLALAVYRPAGFGKVVNLN
jgi:HK97 family phage major capsid protein